MHPGFRAVLFALLALCFSEVQGDKFFGLCYTPFRKFGSCPTDAEVEADVQILLRHSSRVRIYSTECKNVNRILLKHSSEGRLSVLFGVYIDNRPTDQQEVDYLIEALKEYPNAKLEGVVVGNEVMYRNSLPKSTLIQRINEVRDKVRGLGAYNGNESYRTAPIYAVEIFPDPEIGGASDALGLNIHPFYRPDLVDVSDPDEMAAKILKAAQEQIDLYRNMLPSKQIVVTEIGWPTNSDSTELHRGDPIIALKFLQKFTEYAAQSGIQTYWFELFDSPWKKPMYPSNQQTMSEFNFGLYKSDRTTMKTLEDYGYSTPEYYSSVVASPHQPAISSPVAPSSTVPSPVTGSSGGHAVAHSHSESYASGGGDHKAYTPEGHNPTHKTDAVLAPAAVSTHSGVHAFSETRPTVPGHASPAGHRFESSHWITPAQPYRRLLGM